MGTPRAFPPKIHIDDRRVQLVSSGQGIFEGPENLDRRAVAPFLVDELFGECAAGLAGRFLRLPLLARQRETDRDFRLQPRPI